jgi:hypothetical protein
VTFQEICDFLTFLVEELRKDADDQERATAEGMPEPDYDE